MRRKLVNEAKEEAKRLLKRIDELERCAGWKQWTVDGNKATSKPHIDDCFNSGEFTAAVRRSSLDLTKALARLRRG